MGTAQPPLPLPSWERVLHIARAGARKAGALCPHDADDAAAMAAAALWPKGLPSAALAFKAGLRAAFRLLKRKKVRAAWSGQLCERSTLQAYSQEGEPAELAHLLELQEQAHDELVEWLLTDESDTSPRGRTRRHRARRKAEEALGL